MLGDLADDVVVGSTAAAERTDGLAVHYLCERPWLSQRQDNEAVDVTSLLVIYMTKYSDT